MPEQATLRRGIYPPLPTFFDVHEKLDLSTYRRHIQNLAQTGIAGYVVMGTNGEFVHLSDTERIQVIETAREAAGSGAVLLVGSGEQSTYATIENCRRAARASANLALVLPPFHYKGRMDGQALLTHYLAVAEASPLPLVIYNMPASTAGLDLTASTILALTSHPNIVGVKDSSGDIAKLAEIVHRAPAGFATFAGSAGYLLPALAVGAVGAVSALANIFPRQICQLQELFESGHLEEARQIQGRLIPANAAVTSIYSIAGLKAALEITAGYGGPPRSPLLPLGDTERKKLAEILGAVPQPV